MEKSKLLKIYKNFLKIRLCQEKIVEKYHPEDKMKCPMHLCIGQELTPSILGYYLSYKSEKIAILYMIISEIILIPFKANFLYLSFGSLIK